MKPIKLTMQAFGSYGMETVIDFSGLNQNLFLITGDTGAGKTTIFDAIVFALYGEASSEENRKDGVILQSQYVPESVEPFVELVFTEGEDGNGEEKRYTVRRVPAHRKTLTRGAKKGKSVRLVSGSVLLTMPDGSQYEPKETDRKIEEIVGLSKQQFMQVAMIAQGEFMNLLRAKSDDRKVIFRHLFGTGLYDSAVRELKRRRYDADQEISLIRAEVQTIAAGIRIPDTEEEKTENHLETGDAAMEAGELCRGGIKPELCSQVRDGKSLIQDGNLSDLDHFLEGLSALTDALKEETVRLSEEERKASLLRDAAKEAVTKGQTLSDHFAETEEAKKRAGELASLSGTNAEKEKLIQSLTAAYDIKAVYEPFSQAVKSLEKKKKAAEDLRGKIPDLERDVKAAQEAVNSAKAQFDAMHAEKAAVEEKVRTAKEIFRKIRDAESAKEKAGKEYNSAKKNREDREKALGALKLQHAEWKRKLTDLGNAEAAYTGWTAENSSLNAIAEDAGTLEREYRSLERLESEASAAAKAYEQAKKEFLGQNKEYLALQQAYWDAQAGYFVSRLKVGEPCPICGQVVEKLPERNSADREKSLSSEDLAEAQKENDRLKGLQEEAAGNAGASHAKAAAKRSTVLSDLVGLSLKLSAAFRETKAVSAEKAAKEAGPLSVLADAAGRTSGDGEPLGPEDLEAAVRLLTGSLSVLQDAVRVEGERLSEARSEYQKLQESLSGADERENAAAEELEKARNTESEKRSAFDSADAAARSQRGSADFGTEAEADAALDAAIRKEDESSKVFAEAEKAGTKAQENVTRALSLLKKYEEEIPQDGADTDQKQKEYKALLREKDLTEPEWMDLVSGHDRGEIETLRKETKKYGEDMSAAKARLEAAEKLTAGREKPDMNALGEELKEADRVYNEAGASCEEMKEYCRDDQKALEGLLAHRTRRQKAARDYSRIDRLYKLLSGNVTGSRMDIETYVQRYYLERILDAANTRFDEMTSGQYELRMVDDEEAGEGRNRGLDLCVFSTVTGKEREIRSLSGGESFMAALSLALGMADVITQSSSAIRLDVMFIDEGFGTLDDQSRRQAVDVLKRMAESHRMVGIISHVSELKTEIEDQLIVTRDDRGSHVHWEMS